MNIAKLKLKKVPPREALTVVETYDPLVMLSQTEIDTVVTRLRSLRLGTLPLVDDPELEDK